jgi:hypothetical protein
MMLRPRARKPPRPKDRRLTAVSNQGGQQPGQPPPPVNHVRPLLDHGRPMALHVPWRGRSVSVGIARLIGLSEVHTLDELAPVTLTL